VAWLPEFGCALLALAPPDEDADAQPLLDSRHLLLLGLDGWTFELHRFGAGLCRGSGVHATAGG
jgi:hypothetical protein